MFTTTLCVKSVPKFWITDLILNPVIGIIMEAVKKLEKVLFE